jgi:hypothetical protein
MCHGVLLRAHRARPHNVIAISTAANWIGRRAVFRAAPVRKNHAGPQSPPCCLCPRG